MKPMEIIKPCASFEASYYGYISELGDQERYPFVMDLPHQPFAALLRRLNEIEAGISLPNGAVANQTYWLVKGEQLIGVSNLRPVLSEAIAHVGGHIGLGIRPSYRGQGLSKVLLNATLKQAKEQGMKSVSVHCHADNQPSNAMISACGGRLDSVVQSGGMHINRYHIELG